MHDNEEMRFTRLMLRRADDPARQVNPLILLYIDHKTITRTLQICNIRRSSFLSPAEQLPYVNANAQGAACDELPNHALPSAITLSLHTQLARS